MIREILKQQEKTFSFEFFPPKNYGSAVELGVNVGKLVSVSPSFVSVTYGAGGSTHQSSFEICDLFQNKIGLTCMAHYTCVNATKEKINADLDYLYNLNIRNLMLLRGDPPKGDQSYFHSRKEFQYASDLVKEANSQGRFSIGVAGYPEKHMECADLDTDIKNLKFKVDQGADFVVTQMFFDNNHYFAFVERARKEGINVRIIPGIIPITNFSQIRKFSQMCGTTIPDSTVEALESCQDNPEKTYQVGVDLAVKQSEELLRRGAPGIHFYTLNKSDATMDIFASIPKELKANGALVNNLR